jgi:hypothetical protein
MKQHGTCVHIMRTCHIHPTTKPRAGHVCVPALRTRACKRYQRQRCSSVQRLQHLQRYQRKLAPHARPAANKTLVATSLGRNLNPVASERPESWCRPHASNQPNRDCSLTKSLHKSRTSIIIPRLCTAAPRLFTQGSAQRYDCPLPGAGSQGGVHSRRPDASA